MEIVLEDFSVRGEVIFKPAQSSDKLLDGRESKSDSNTAAFFLRQT